MITTAGPAITYKVKVTATTTREAIEYTRSILPVSVAKSTNLTARRTGSFPSTFEVYA